MTDAELKRTISEITDLPDGDHALDELMKVIKSDRKRTRAESELKIATYAIEVYTHNPHKAESLLQIIIDHRTKQLNTLKGEQ